MRIIAIDGQSKVVEYTEAGQVKRRILPVDSDAVALGVPFGLPFAVIMRQHGLDSRMAGKIEQELHKVGIWTADDIRSNSRAVQGAVQAAYGVDTAILLNLVKEVSYGRG